MLGWSSLQFQVLGTGLMEEPGRCFRPGYLHYKWLQVGEMDATFTVLIAFISLSLAMWERHFTGNRPLKLKQK